MERLRGAGTLFHEWGDTSIQDGEEGFWHTSKIEDSIVLLSIDIGSGF